MFEVAVIGGGHGCYAAAANLADEGHAVRMWRRDGEAFGPVLRTRSLKLKDRSGEREARLTLASTDMAAVLDGAELVVAPLPGTAQADLASVMAPHLRDGQVVFIPPGSFGSIIFARAMKAAGNRAEVAFVESGTLPWLARKHGPAEVAITARTTALPTGVFPSRLGQQALAVVRKAFPEIIPAADALDAALLNGGPIIHPPLILMNAGPIEHFDHWDIHKEGTQPSVRAVHDALDAERVKVREALGYGERHWWLADHYGVNGKTSMYGDLAHAKLTDSGDWREKLDLGNHRYMREDVQLGLVFLVSLGRWLGLPMPVAEGLLAIAGAVVGEDLADKGRTLANLGLADCTKDGLRLILREGLPQ